MTIPLHRTLAFLAAALCVASLLPGQDPEGQSAEDAAEQLAARKAAAMERRTDEPGGLALFDEAWDALQAIEPATGVEPRHVRVLWLGDARTEAVVSWTTREEGEGHMVHFDTEDHGADREAYARSASPFMEGRYTRDRREAKRDIPTSHYHHARLTGLTPGTRYHFVVANKGASSRTFHFFTAAPDGRRFTLLAGGDSRSNALDRCRVNLLIRDMVAESDGVLALVHSGDYIASGRLWQQWQAWLNHHELTIPESGRVLPIVPARGNHDFGPLFDEVFAAPGGAMLNLFPTRLGGRCAVVTLNTNIAGNGPQLGFLKRQLKQLRPEVDWLLANYHRPLYPAVKSPASAKPFWAPEFEKHNVDLALEGDGHSLKRTCRIRGDAFDPTGVAYVGEGGLGVGQRVPDTERWWFQNGGMAGRGHHVMVLDISPTQITYRAVLLDRSDADQAVFLPMGQRAEEQNAVPAGR